jgi:hypothetical protein
MEFRHVLILVQSVNWNINTIDHIIAVVGGGTGGDTLLLVVDDIWNILNNKKSLF